MLLEGFSSVIVDSNASEAAVSSDTRANGLELEVIARQIERAHSHHCSQTCHCGARRKPACLYRPNPLAHARLARHPQRLVPFTGIIGRRPINARDFAAHRSNIRAQLSAMVHAIEQRNP